MFVSSLIGFVTCNFSSTVHQSSVADAGSSGETKNFLCHKEDMACKDWEVYR